MINTSPVPHRSGASLSMNNQGIAFWISGSLVKKLRCVLMHNVPSFTIFTQVWTTNSTVFSLLPFLNTLLCISLSPNIQLSRLTSRFLTAFNTSPHPHFVKGKAIHHSEERKAEHLAGDEWDVTCLICWNICRRIPKCGSVWAYLREFPHICPAWAATACKTSTLDHYWGPNIFSPIFPTYLM